MRAKASRSASAAPQGGGSVAARRHGNAWLVAAICVLAFFTVFVLLDTFAIARVQQEVVSADTTSITAASNTVASADAAKGSAADQGDAATEGGSNEDGGGIVYSSHKENVAAAESTTAAEAGTADVAASAFEESATSGGSDSGEGASESSAAQNAEDSQAVESVSQAEGDCTYTDENISIGITKVRAYDTDVYVADIQVSSVEYLKTALAQNAFGRNLKDTTSNMAQDSGAVLAINGDYYGFRDDGYVVRNGVLYRDTPSANTDALVVYGDGSMGSANQDEVSAQELVDAGAWQVLSFGPVLIEDGQICVSEGQEVSGKSMASNPRTAIGMVSPLHYVVVVSDGRTGEDAGLSLAQLAEVMADAGATFAYNLDGGGSTTMWFEGNVINDPASGNRSGEREVSDIVYFG